MTSTAMTNVSGDRRTGLLGWALAGIAGAAIVIIFGNTGVDHAAGENGGLVSALVSTALCAVLTAVLFALVLRRPARGRTQAVLATLSVVSLVVFWTGAPAVLGAATAAAAARPSRSLTAAGWIGLAAGALAVTWSVVSQFL